MINGMEKINKNKNEWLYEFFKLPILYTTNIDIGYLLMLRNTSYNLVYDYIRHYNEARERSEPFFPWFSKGKQASS